MTDSYTAELRDIIDRAFTEEYGGRATVQMVHEATWRDLPEHLRDFLIGKGLRAQVRAYFNDKDEDNLPKRPEVNAAGEHAQLHFLSVDEFGYVHDAYAARVKANAEQREKVRLRCLAVHGVDLERVKADSA